MLVNTWQMLSPHLIRETASLWWNETSGNNWLRLAPCDNELIFNSSLFVIITTQTPRHVRRVPGFRPGWCDSETLGQVSCDNIEAAKVLRLSWVKGRSVASVRLVAESKSQPHLVTAQPIIIDLNMTAISTLVGWMTMWPHIKNYLGQNLADHSPSTTER